MKPSPALTFRSEHYPPSWRGRVPVRIRMAKTVRPDPPMTWLPENAGMAAELDRDYPCWVNSHGAVAAILPDGRHIGVKPYEFDVVEWTTPAEGAS